MSAFHGRRLPEPGRPVGYAALVDCYDLAVPLPSRLAAISERHHRYSTDKWVILTPRHAPLDTLGGQLGFAFKWEGVDLAVLAHLFRAVPAGEVAAVVREKPTGSYARRIWFLYEWLTGRGLDVADAGKVRSVLAVDPEQQFVLQRGPISRRHKVVNNLPGTPDFCPLVRRTEALARFEARRLDEQARRVMGRTHPDILARAAAFLLLSDSRSSFQIEGEQPSYARTARWGQAIAQAGSVPLTIEEFERLQRLVVGDARFVRLGLREKGGFIGEHDRFTGEPLPVHISARPDDIESLLRGLMAYQERTLEAGLDPVVAAAAVAFGFVYVHPFDDGNGRLHRWLIHHVLSAAGYNPPGVVFPVSAVVLRYLTDYRRVLESHSRPLLQFIDWRPTESGNVEVLNDTADYYRYFDATPHAEFLYRCVEETVEKDLPEEVAYLEAYDRFVEGVQQVVDMPARTVDLLHRFLRQGGGRLSKRARTREFQELSHAEVSRFERLFRESFAGGVGADAVPSSGTADRRDK